MKLTTRILIGIFVLMMGGLLSSNMILKKQYDALDKSDIYWTYNKVLEQPFKYLNITGGNGTNIYYEQSDKPSVRLLQEWVQYHHGEVKAVVQHDTLFLNFDYSPSNLFEKFYLENAAPVRIFSPELLSVTGNNTHFEMQKLKQKSITVHITGRSKFEVESMYPDLDSVNVYQSDTSSVVFEMSPDYRKNPNEKQTQGKIEFHDANGSLIEDKKQEQNNFDETMSFRSVQATVQGHSILDIGHAQIQNLQAQVSDSSAIVLSGNALKKLP
ncbi:MAG TPA: hypothetical protein VHB70_19470 [Parafilimonas sp.]|nr:hypothetical protein [Parafilimonas sp.]